MWFRVFHPYGAKVLILLTLTDNQGYQQTPTHAAKNPKTNKPLQIF
jgi:hypothetical protein